MTALAIPEPKPDDVDDADDAPVGLQVLLLAPPGQDVERIAAAFPPGFAITHVATPAAARAALAAGVVDAALVFAIPPHDADLRALAGGGAPLALIALTDPADARAGLAAMRAGAQEFVALDSPPAALRRAVRYAIERAELLAEFKALHGALLAAERRAEENERLRAFVDRVSHEFRTPAAVITLACDRIERETTGAEKAIGRIREALDRQTELIESLLDASRDALDPPALGRAVIDVVPVAQAARARQGAAADRIRIDFDGDARILADAKGLGAALDRLLDNALRHGADDAVVQIAIGRQDDDVTIAVRDHGPGVPADEREKIWAPFWRGARAQGEGGAGLGLDFVRQTITGFGGSVAVGDALGGGAIFTLRLPGSDKIGKGVAR